MFTPSLRFSSPVDLSRFQTPASQEHLGQWTGILVGTLFSPTWFMCKAVFSYYLPLDTLFHKGITVPAMVEFITQLEALGPTILLGQIVPILFICQVVSLTFLYGCGWLGKATARIINKTRRSNLV